MINDLVFSAPLSLSLSLINWTPSLLEKNSLVVVVVYVVVLSSIIQLTPDTSMVTKYGMYIQQQQQGEKRERQKHRKSNPKFRIAPVKKALLFYGRSDYPERWNHKNPIDKLTLSRSLCLFLSLLFSYVCCCCLFRPASLSWVYFSPNKSFVFVEHIKKHEGKKEKESFFLSYDDQAQGATHTFFQRLHPNILANAFRAL